MGGEATVDGSRVAVTVFQGVGDELSGKGGSLTGPNPVDRGKKGSKLHVLSDAQGIPLAVAVSGANMHDSLALKPLIRGIPAVRSRRGPRRRRPVKLRADKAYFLAFLGLATALTCHKKLAKLAT